MKQSSLLFRRVAASFKSSFEIDTERLTQFRYISTSQQASSLQKNFTSSTPHSSPISSFIDKYFLHFNAATLKDASVAYNDHLSSGGKMLVSLAGAMSTAELGKIFAEMIRQDKVHIISCTGANLEEDVMNLVAHNHYRRIPAYRSLKPEEDQALFEENLNRVTDTCIPETEAFRVLESHLLSSWTRAKEQRERKFPHEYMYEILLKPEFQGTFQAKREDSWLLAAAEKNLPIVVPGWEDCTMGNIFTSHCYRGKFPSSLVKSGVEYMLFLIDWYRKNASSKSTVGFYQIGGGIAGDFPICVVPLLQRDLGEEKTPLWGYFCQISDSPTSYGSYSGATPSEKISWGKLGVETPNFIIESDATIAAPLMFAYILGM